MRKKILISAALWRALTESELRSYHCNMMQDRWPSQSEKEISLWLHQYRKQEWERKRGTTQQHKVALTKYICQNFQMTRYTYSWLKKLSSGLRTNKTGEGHWSREVASERLCRSGEHWSVTGREEKEQTELCNGHFKHHSAQRRTKTFQTGC